MQYDNILKKIILYCGWGGGGHFGKRHNLNKLSSPQRNAIYRTPCGFRQEDFFVFSYLAYVTPGASLFWPKGYN